MSGESSIRELLEAIADGAGDRLYALLDETATLRLWTASGASFSGGRDLTVLALQELRTPWQSSTLQVISAVASSSSGSAQFRVQARESGKVVEVNASVFIAQSHGAIMEIDIYLAQPMLAAERGEIVRAGLGEAERRAVAQMLEHRQDFREPIAPGTRFEQSRTMFRLWSQVAHPGSNQVLHVRWKPEEADERIEETVDWFRKRGLGVQWTVGPFDTPPDLGERLLRHGFLHAGKVAMMLRFGLDDLDSIPTNTDIEIIDLRERPDLREASLQVGAKAFYWDSEQIDQRREEWFSEIEQPNARAFIALLDGAPVANGNLFFQSGVAYLGGAATLPEFRGRRIYSTMLRSRLECARDEGYEVAMTYAEPMSRRIVSRFGFQNYAEYDVFGWMEPMDPEVISKLVIDE
ncbi:MAG: GNAT family N-acetyltransferase [Polyangiales bacterium]